MSLFRTLVDRFTWHKDEDHRLPDDEPEIHPAEGQELVGEEPTRLESADLNLDEASPRAGLEPTPDERDE
jgi:hypothetical protein